METDFVAVYVTGWYVRFISAYLIKAPPVGRQLLSQHPDYYYESLS